MAQRWWWWCVGVMLAVAGPASGMEDDDAAHGDGVGASVSVVGSASTWLVPDRIVIELSVQARALTPLAAYDDLAERVAGVYEALGDAGVALDSEVTTVGLQLWERTHEGERVHVGSNRVMVERALPADDPHAATRFIRSVLGAGATGFGGLSFGIDPKARADAEQQLLERAVHDARHKAEILATAEGRWVGPALRIAMVGPVYPSGPGPQAALLRESADSASIPVVAGEGVRLETSVEVVFALE